MCGVLVFDSVLPCSSAFSFSSRSSRPPTPHTLCPHTLCQHTLCQHTLCHYILCQHTLCQHTLCQHTLSTHTLSPHTLSTYTLSTHSVNTHFVTTYFVNIHFVNTLCQHTLCQHTLLSTHTLSTHSVNTHFAYSHLHTHTHTQDILCQHTLHLHTHTHTRHTLSTHTLSPHIHPRFTWQAWHTTHIYCRFTWQAWHKLASTVVLRGRRGTDGTGWRAWTGLGAYCRFTWQAWHKLASTVVLRGRRGTDGTGWRAWTGLGACDAAALCVAGVAQPDIHRRFTWQAWHNVTSTVVLRGRRGTHGTGWRAWTGLGACDAAALCVAGVAQTHIYCRFTWQAWHKLASTVVLRGRRGTHGTGWRAWTGLGACDAAALCVAGVAQPDIHRRFTWQAWHKLASTVVLRGRRGTHGTGWRAWTGLGACDAAALCVAGVAQTHIYCRFTWQAWHKLASTVVLRGRRGTHGTGWRAWTGLGACDAAALCVAGVAQTHIHLRFTWQAWHKLASTVVLRGRRGTHGTGWRAWTGLGACDAAAFCVAGVAQTHIHLRFTWQAWHKLASTVVLRGRRGTHGTGWRAWTGLGACDAAAFCVAGVAQTHIHLRFTWQAWHKLASTVVLRGRRGTRGTGWRAWTGLGACDAAALCVAGVAQTHIHLRFTWQAWHKLASTVVLRGRRRTDGSSSGTRTHTHTSSKRQSWAIRFRDGLRCTFADT